MSSLDSKLDRFEKQAKLLEPFAKTLGELGADNLKVLNYVKNIEGNVEKLHDRLGDVEDNVTFSLKKNYCPSCSEALDEDYYCSYCCCTRGMPQEKLTNRMRKLKYQVRDLDSNDDTLKNKMNKLDGRLDELNEKFDDIADVVKYGPLSQCMVDAKSDFQKNANL